MAHNNRLRLSPFFSFLDKEVQPQRVKFDRDTSALFSLFYKMADFNMLGAYVAKQDGGLGLSVIEKHQFVSHLMRSSGALYLLQTQHQSVQHILATSNNETLKQQYLSNSYHGDIRLGIGYSHLHQVNNPPVLAQENTDHYRVTGKVRYATGYGLFNWLALGFVCDEKEIIALIPFAAQNNLVIEETLPLIAGSASQTIRFSLNTFKVPKTHVISQEPIGSFHQKSIRARMFPSIHLGLMQATLDLIEKTPLMQEGIVQECFLAVKQKIMTYEKAIFDYPENTIIAPLRAQGLRLLQEIFLFADQIFRGAAVLKEHPLHLIKSEAQLFSALAAEETLLQATCHSIVYDKLHRSLL